MFQRGDIGLWSLTLHQMFVKASQQECKACNQADYHAQCTPIELCAEGQARVREEAQRVDRPVEAAIVVKVALDALTAAHRPARYSSHEQLLEMILGKALLHEHLQGTAETCAAMKAMCLRFTLYTLLFKRFIRDENRGHTCHHGTG